MPTELDQLTKSLRPENTVLLFGAGSSMPSGIVSAAGLGLRLADRFGVSGSYSLSEVASLIEYSHSRAELVRAVRDVIGSPRPTGGLLNLPLYDWKSIYTTNYDDLIEQCYAHHEKEIVVYSSDFDFTVHNSPDSVKLFKMHGTIEKDVSDGNNSRLIITESDYDATGNYRTGIYDRLKADMTGAQLVVIGNSLEDQDIKTVVNRAIGLNQEVPGSRRVSLLLYTEDSNRALLYEKRGVEVIFGGIDKFFASLAANRPTPTEPATAGGPLDEFSILRPSTVDVDHASSLPANFSAMFNGWPATHSDVLSGYTFERNISMSAPTSLLADDTICGVIMGPSGVGKTTAARQVLQKLRANGLNCWEHHSDHTLNAHIWRAVAKSLQEKDQSGVLFVDDAHLHLPEICQLTDALVADQVESLRLICGATTSQWLPRAKSPSLHKRAKEFHLRKLEIEEIERLLNMIDRIPEVKALVEKSFSGFSRYERRRRLIDRCEAEMFVCLKNIFASEKFDDIILREFAELSDNLQNIYRFVAALESSGVRVHRQLIIRLLGLNAEAIGAALVHLSDIISEYTISQREGIYGWRCRHQVIASIITRYKYPDPLVLAELFALVIDNISPTFDVELMSMRELCNIESGIPSIPDTELQNTLLRKMMSVAPGERVPRHRLIRNLIRMGQFEKADTEIRIFEKDFGVDGPVARYKVMLLVARARAAEGIMDEDRITILNQARGLVVESIQRFPFNIQLLREYCEVGVETYKRTGNYAVFDEAIAELRAGEERIGDPGIPKIMARYEARLRSQPAHGED